VVSIDQEQDRIPSLEESQVHDDPAIQDDLLLDEALNQQRERRRRFLVRALAIVLVVAFIPFAFNGILYLFGMPSFSLLIESYELSRDPKYKDLRKAVVAVVADNRQGTGFIVDPQGLIITNNHIIASAKQVKIGMDSDDERLAKDWQQWPEADLAIVRVEGEDLPTLELTQNDDPLDPGEPLTVIGNPMGLFQIVSEAVYIGESRVANLKGSMIMIRGSVYRGNSGSPVINTDGQVVGILFAVAEDENGDAKQRIAFVIPASMIQEKWDESNLQQVDD